MSAQSTVLHDHNNCRLSLSLRITFVWPQSLAYMNDICILARMGLTNYNGPANLGTLDIHCLIPLAPLAKIFAEWIVIIPLVCHLASIQQSYQLIGNIALTGLLHVGLFPKLGVTDNIARFLKEGCEYIDRASSTGNTKQEVGLSKVFGAVRSLLYLRTCS